MPLSQGSSQETISHNIGELISAGHEPDQAAAIAYNEARKEGEDAIEARPTSLDDYAYTPTENISDAKLPIDTEARVSLAIDALSGDKNAPHGQGVQIPADARAGVVRKISGAIGRLNVSDERKQELRDKLSPHRGKASTYIGGSALKALGNWRVGGYLVVFGGPKDAQGEYFRNDCDFHLDWFGGTTRPILYHHGLNDQDTIEEIGYIDKLLPDAHGLWAEGPLDMHDPRTPQVYNDVRHGKLGWSSGSAPHLSKVEPDGGISEWAIVEASLTPSPAAGKRTTVQALKFDFTSSFTSPKDGRSPGEPGTVKEAARRSNGTKGELSRTNNREDRTMTLAIKNHVAMIAAMEKAGIAPDQMIEVLKGYGGDEPDGDEMMADPTELPPADTAPEQPAKDAGPVLEGDGGADIHDSGPEPAQNPPQQPAPPMNNAKTLAKAAGNDARVLAATMQQLMATMKTAQAQSKVQPAQFDNPARSAKSRITDMHTPYHDLDAADMAYMFQLFMGARTPKIMPAEFQREMATKALKDYNTGKLILAPDVANKAIKSAEFQNIVVANDGANWVPDLWSSILWMRVRIDNNVAKNIEVFQMPSPTFEYPIESTDPTIYAVGESESDTEMTLSSNVFTRSKMVTSKLQFSAKKVGLQVGFSTEINEDSIIPFIPQLRGQATRAFANAIDNLILNSDSVTGTGNINYKGANTSAAATSKFLFGGGDGMRKNALVTNTAVAVNFQGGLPTLGKLRAVRFKMISSTNAYGIDPTQVVIVTDPYTYGTFLAIDEINVFMNNGQGATVNTGVVPAIDGSPVYASAEMLLGDSTGYYPSDNTGTLGNFVMFAKQGWKVGYVRQVMTDVSYVPWNDNYILTMTARLAIGKKDTVASAVGFNILTTLA